MRLFGIRDCSVLLYRFETSNEPSEDMKKINIDKVVEIDHNSPVVKSEFKIKTEMDMEPAPLQEYSAYCSTRVEEEMYEETESKALVFNQADLDIKEELEIGPTVLQHSFPPSESAKTNQALILGGSNSDDDTSSATESTPSDLIECILMNDRKKVYSCKICKQEKPRSELMRHIRTHTGEKPFSCDICKEKFGYSSTLNRHKVFKHKVNSYKNYKGTHKKEFGCNKCIIKCTSRFALYKHKASHKDRQMFLCDICDSSLSSRSSLIVHMRNHSNRRPFACDRCDSVFSTSSHLKRHSLIHTGERPFQCDHCDASFRTSYCLRTHRFIHTGQKPYRCDLCDLEFAHGSNLKVHKLNKHKLKCRIKKT